MQPFGKITPREAIGTLRYQLKLLGVCDAVHYRTQDIRRGHAQDMLQGGASLAEILRAGEWRSAAFTTYLDEEILEAGGAV